MKIFKDSIAKSIKNFKKFNKEQAIRALHLHYHQWIEQEELWTIEETNDNAALYNTLVELAQNKYPELREQVE